MLDLITIGTVGIDLYYRGSALSHSKDTFELAIGGKYFVDFFYQGLGGGATNVAIGVAKTDKKVGVIVKIGNNPFKKIIMDRLDEFGIVHRNLSQVETGYYNLSSIFLTEKGEKTIVNYRSPHQHLIASEEDFQHLTKTRSIYLANLPNVSFTERMKILSFANSKNILTFVNLGVVDCRRPKHQLQEFLKKVECLIINGHEFADLVKAPYNDIDFSEDVIAHYVPELSDNVVVITDGENGSYGYRNKQVFVQKALPIETILDATGAGDGFTAGFIAEFLKTSDMEKSLHSGAKYAVKILGKIGAN